MNFEIGQFNLMLESFANMCDNYAVNTVNNVEKMQITYNKAAEMFATNEITLNEQLANECTLVKTKNEALKNVEQLNEQLVVNGQTLEAQIVQLNNEIANIKN